VAEGQEEGMGEGEGRWAFPPVPFLTAASKGSAYVCKVMLGGRTEGEMLKVQRSTERECSEDGGKECVKA